MATCWVRGRDGHQNHTTTKFAAQTYLPEAAWGGTGTHILSYTTANAGAANSESNAI